MSSLEDLAEVVAPQVLLDAVRVGELLAELRVPHVLIGGLAVGLDGHPRATKDVDYMVGPEAFQTTEPILVCREELKEKLDANRAQDRADVAELVGAGADVLAIGDFLQRNAPELVSRFLELTQTV